MKSQSRGGTETPACLIIRLQARIHVEACKKYNATSLKIFMLLFITLSTCSFTLFHGKSVRRDTQINRT